MSDSVEQSISVAIIDDEDSIRETAVHYLKKNGYEVKGYASAEECLEVLGEGIPDILITDLRMPGIDGIGMLERVKALDPTTEVIIITAHADKTVAIDALRLGAFDFFEKPISLVELGETIERTVRYQTALRERDQYAKKVVLLSAREAQRWGIETLVGKSSALQQIISRIRLVQKADNTSVLVTGESGTGKELIARAIHFGGSRRANPFVPVNCSAIPAELGESILFGHVRGSFTGATSDRKGCFEEADTGTLFLDEIGDMPASMQAKLLRVLEDGEVTRVGSPRGRKVDVRILAATNTDLEARMESGDFRSDLFYRIARFSIVAPPLRDRPEDIVPLTHHFVDKIAQDMGIKRPSIEPEAEIALKAYAFPGNVRELRNIIEGALIESAGESIDLPHLRLSKARSSGGQMQVTAGEVLPANLRDAESVIIKRAVEQCGGNMSAAARALGISRTKLYRKLAKDEVV